MLRRLMRAVFVRTPAAAGATLRTVSSAAHGPLESGARLTRNAGAGRLMLALRSARGVQRLGSFGALFEPALMYSFEFASVLAFLLTFVKFGVVLVMLSGVFF